MRAPIHIARLLCLGACQDLEKEAGLSGDNLLVAIEYESFGSDAVKTALSVDRSGKVAFFAMTRDWDLKPKRTGFEVRTANKTRQLDGAAFRRLAIHLREWRARPGENLAPKSCNGPNFGVALPEQRIVWTYANGQVGQRILSQGCYDAPSKRLREAAFSMYGKLSASSWYENFFHRG